VLCLAKLAHLPVEQFHRAGDDRLNQGWYKLAVERSCDSGTILQELSLAAEQKSSRWAATPSIWPVKGWVTSGFGPRVSPFTEKPAWHDGLDIGAAANAPVQAPAQGRVTAVGFDPKLGNLVKVDHGFGIETLYGHLAKALVKEGQRVKRGEVVGLVGSSGLATGPHLHYMVKVNGQTFDPVKYILE
jgi:murein DD-endopeptidase MepM/ murein hydrolase activator NlpD